MMTIFTIVTAKKGSGWRGSLTRTAVTVKTSMMASRLPITRRRWETLKQAEEDQQSADDTWFWKDELEIDQRRRKKWINVIFKVCDMCRAPSVQVCWTTLLLRCLEVQCSQWVQQGVEAGEEQQRQHSAQRHHVVEFGFQHAAVISGCIRLIGWEIVQWRVLQAAGEVLETHVMMLSIDPDRTERATSTIRNTVNTGSKTPTHQWHGFKPFKTTCYSEFWWWRPKTISHQSTGRKLSRAQSGTVCRRCEFVSKLFSWRRFVAQTLFGFLSRLETCVQRGRWDGSPVSSELWLICCVPVEGLQPPEDPADASSVGRKVRTERCSMRRSASCVSKCRPRNLQIREMKAGFVRRIWRCHWFVTPASCWLWCHWRDVPAHFSQALSEFWTSSRQALDGKSHHVLCNSSIKQWQCCCVCIKTTSFSPKKAQSLGRD